MARFKIRKPYGKEHIANAIINEVIDAKRGSRAIDTDNIRKVIEPIIDESNFKVVVNLDSNQGQKTINITVPIDGFKFDGTSMTLAELIQFVDRKWPNAEDVEEFGRICLYGCGR